MLPGGPKLSEERMNGESKAEAAVGERSVASK